MNEIIKLKLHAFETIIEKNVAKGTTLLEIAADIQHHLPHEIMAAKINNNIRELTYRVEEDSEIYFWGVGNHDGNRIYQRSLSFIFILAVKELFGRNCIVNIEHSLSKGLYCEIKNDKAICEADALLIKNRMRALVEEDIIFKKECMPMEEALGIFKENNMYSKIKLLQFRQEDYINVYSCKWLKNYFYGYMVPSTGYLKDFDLKCYAPGLILRFPEMGKSHKIPEFKEQKKLASIFQEAEKWGKIMDLSYVSDLDERIKNNQFKEVVRISEALHEKKIAAIADEITKSKKRIILIAGPSSSGKTTFAQRLLIQLKVNGLKPIALSTDNYFVERDETPVDKKGEYDFEAIHSIDLELFNKQLNTLLNGEEVDLPTFNFKMGEKEYNGKKLKIAQDQLIIIEGIHSLNEELTKDISKDKKFKIYISALTQLNIDNHNRVPTTDARLIRRITRDSKYRGHSATRTLQLWGRVRKGEEKNIFPFQEEADVMFNSALVYELAVLKKYVEPLLREITEAQKEYPEAKRLLKFLSYFLSIDDEDSILNNSIIKEFIGGSCFVEEE